MAHDPAKGRRPSAPPKSGAAGRRLWHEVVGEFDLTLTERVLLEQACREADLIARMEKALDGDAEVLFVKGSKGQDVPNPLLAEVRQHRTALAALLTKLDLDAEEAGGGAPVSGDGGAARRSSAARELAAHRWRRPA